MKSSGFTLIEIIVSITILAVFLVMAVSTVTIMIRNMRVNEHRIVATYYSEDLINWLRFEKENNWTAFLKKATDPDNDPSTPTPVNGQKYCANEATINTTSSGEQTIETINTLFTVGPCNFDGITNNSDTNPKIFKREVLFKALPPTYDQVNVTITVEWQELGKTYKVETSSPFYFLE